MIPCQTAPRRAIAVVVVLLASCSFVWAQSGRGTVSGTVHDSSGASVPGAKVTVINSATNETYDLATNDAGDYTAADLPARSYSVRVEKTRLQPIGNKGSDSKRGGHCARGCNVANRPGAAHG